MPKQEKPISYTLRRIPADVREIIKAEQERLKSEIGIEQITFEYAIYRVIRDFKKCRDGELGQLQK